jgi:putative transposase
MIETATSLSSSLATEPACRHLGVPRSSYYRAKRPKPEPGPAKQRRRDSARALSQAERSEVRLLLNSDRFCDASPRQVYATLLDEGRYVCHWRTMYRVLEEHDEVRERRNQLRHPSYAKPELLATAANQLWSWDITKLRGPEKWTYYYLYVLLDVFSRYVVGWMIARQESSILAKELIETSCQRQGIDQNQLVLHSDRGPSMISKTVAQLLVDLGVEKSHSRPHVSNDNPYSEAQFKTMKYRGDYPDRFGSIEDARSWAREFFPWYNEEHHHTALGLMPPAVVHYGKAERVRAQRRQVLSAAYAEHPERFVRGLPSVAEVPAAVWINAPKSEQ